ncbi:hypothetical protein HYALB_00010714 [Hymenoscyphus albidus]|uniref:Rhodopsin domain-containing protein n=1 Tax=Hymenoscyphus albidus TaxID=595503 RepID=A0A9N9M040_9HELO|nr:hypothetical protein HYALB_00010714 [Hymenoscyphus albidus]
MSDVLPTQVSPQATLAALIISVVVPLLVVLLRLWGNYANHKKLLAEDYFSIVAIIYLAVEAGVCYADRVVLNDPVTTLKFIGNFIIIGGVIAILASYFARVPLVLLYLRFFGVKKWLRVSSYTFLIVYPLTLVAGVIFTAVKCNPNGKDLDAPWLGSCIHNGFIVGVWNGSFAALSDIILFILPLPIVFNLHLFFDKKLSLVVVFMTGILGITASLVTLYYRGSSLAGVSDNEIGQILGQVLEHAIAIMAGCAPTLRTVWINQVITTGLYARLQSAVTSPDSASTQKLSATKNPSGGRPGDIGSREYLELGEPRILRNGDQLAARMTGSIKVDGADTEFESFMFAKVNAESGKMEWLIERSIWGPVGGVSKQGVN